jgi:Domain of unknown function (DUF6457)
MSGWLDDLAGALGVDPLSNQEIGRLLPTAREIAHRLERKDTPLATFLLGMATGQRVEAGTARPDAFQEVVDVALARLPDEPAPAG